MPKYMVRCSLVYMVETKFERIDFNSECNILHAILKNAWFLGGVDYFKVIKTVRDKVS